MPRQNVHCSPAFRRLLFAGLVTLSILWADGTERLRRANPESVARFTPQQVMDRCQRICERLFPDAVSISLTVVPLRSATTIGPPGMAWYADVSDQSAEHLMHVDLDGATGDLMQFTPGVPVAIPGTTTVDEMSADAARAASRRWLEILGCAKTAGAWRRSEPPPDAPNGIWMEEYAKPGRVCCVYLDCQGRLVNIFAWPSVRPFH